MQHHTKNKGDLGLLKVMVDLTEKGYACFTSTSEHLPFDLIAYKNGVSHRIQVKYRTVTDGKVSVSMASSWADRNGSHRVLVDKEEIDVYAVYVPDIDKCMYFDPNAIGRSLNIRIEPPKNNQSKNVKLYTDFLEMPK